MAGLSASARAAPGRGTPGSAAEVAIQLSTAASDLLLALVTAGACVALRRRGERYVSTGLLLVACAAFIGSLRFAVNPELADLHRFTTALATHTGMPLIGVQYASTAFGRPGPDGRMVTMGVSVVGFSAFGLAFPLPIYGTLVGAGSMAVVIAASSTFADRRRAIAAIAGALGVALAGLVIGTEGALGPVLRIDVFHAVLTAAFVGLAAGLPPRVDDGR